MVNSAIIAGLVAGYTLSAVVTAFLAAEDAPDDGARHAAVDRSGQAACAGALRRARRSARCLAGRSSNQLLTTQRR